MMPTVCSEHRRDLDKYKEIQDEGRKAALRFQSWVSVKGHGSSPAREVAVVLLMLSILSALFKSSL